LVLLFVVDADFDDVGQVLTIGWLGK